MSKNTKKEEEEEEFPEGEEAEDFEDDEGSEGDEDEDDEEEGNAPTMLDLMTGKYVSFLNHSQLYNIFDRCTMSLTYFSKFGM